MAIDCNHEWVDDYSGDFHGPDCRYLRVCNKCKTSIEVKPHEPHAIRDRRPTFESERHGRGWIGLATVRGVLASLEKD